MREQVKQILTNMPRTKKLEKSMFLAEFSNAVADNNNIILTPASDTFENVQCQNLFGGVIQDKNILVTTYYDTGQRLLTKAYNPRDHYQIKVNNAKRAIAKTAIHVLFWSVAIYFICMKFIAKQPLMIADIYIVVAAVLYIVSLKMVDTPLVNHQVHNDSSIITLFDAMLRNNRIGYALTDFGFDNMQGDKVIAELLRKADMTKTVVMLDCLGADSTLVYATAGQVPKNIITALEAQGIYRDEELVTNLVELYPQAIRIYPATPVPIDSKMSKQGKENMEKIKQFLLDLS